jgi:hypothetical protein
MPVGKRHATETLSAGRSSSNGIADVVAGASRRVRGIRCRKLAICAAGASLAAFVVPAVATTNGAGATTPAYRFTVVAKIGAPAPGGGIFPFDFEPSAINDAGTVAFTADVSDSSGNDIGEGVFVESGGHITQVNRVGLPAPGASTFGSGEFGRVGLNAAGNLMVPFSLAGWDPNTNIPSGGWTYTRSSGALKPVAVPGMTMPGGGTLQGIGFNPSLNDQGDVAFSGLVTGSQVDPSGPGLNGIALGQYMAQPNGTVTSVVQPGDPAPGGGTFDDAWNGYIDNLGDIAFGAYVKGDPCNLIAGNPYICADSLYLRSGKTGVISSVAHEGDPAPGGGHFVNAFGGVLNNSGQMAFIGDLSPTGYGQVFGVFSDSNGVLSAIARPGQAMPGGGSFVSAAGIITTYGINNKGAIAFAAALNTDSLGSGNDDTGLFVSSHGTVHLVARTGTVIPGLGTIATLSQYQPLPAQPNYATGGAINDRGQVVVNATLTNGEGVLLVATPTT